jgi:hypothetical protein
MEKLGHSYVTATDGLEAVKAYQAAAGNFDIIFMGKKHSNFNYRLLLPTSHRRYPNAQYGRHASKL